MSVASVLPPSSPTDDENLPREEERTGLPPWDWRSLPFVLMHVAAVVLPFFVPFSWGLVGLAIALYLARMFAMTGVYHRYFSHRTYKTSRAFQFVLAVWGRVQKGPLWWAAHHRHHHVHATARRPALAACRASSGAHVGWIMPRLARDATSTRVPDLGEVPRAALAGPLALVPGIALAVALFLVGGWRGWSGASSSAPVLTGTAPSRSTRLTHMFGRRRYPTRRQPQQLDPGARHAGRGLAQQPPPLPELDPPGLLLVGDRHHVLHPAAFAAVGLVWDLREPPAHVVSGEWRQREAA